MAFLVTVFRAFEKCLLKHTLVQYVLSAILSVSKLFEVAIFGGRYIRICQQTLPLNFYGYLNVTRSLKTAVLCLCIKVIITIHLRSNN